VIRNNQFIGELCISIRIRGSERTSLGDWYHVFKSRSISVYSGGRREDDVGYIVLGHGPEQAYCAEDVDAIVLQGFLAGLADSLHQWVSACDGFMP